MWSFSVEEKKRKTQTPKENGKKGTREKGRTTKKEGNRQNPSLIFNLARPIRFDRPWAHPVYPAPAHPLSMSFAIPARTRRFATPTFADHHC